ATPYSSNTNFNDANTSGLPSMLLMHWNIDNGVYKLSIREKRSTASGNLDGFKAISALNPSISFVNGGEYDIQVYANNSSTNASYTKNNTPYTVAARSSHVWVNNTILLYEVGNPNFIDQDSNLAAGALLNAFIFLGYNNDQNNNDAQAYLDDFVYANYLENINVLPVVLDGFSATKQNNDVLLNWKTLSEKDNAKFEIFRYGDADQTPKLIKTVTGKGNTSTLTNYSTTDNSPLIGNNYYKLVQLDFNGKADTLATAAAKIGFNKSEFNIYAESDNSVRLSINSLTNENAAIEIYNLSGQCLVSEKLRLTEGANQLTIPVQLGKGVYVAVLKTNEDQYKTKFISK
ncbi:MAG: T9SS type A sorting domain-containing protein, partial [Pedobacter sp.]